MKQLHQIARRVDEQDLRTSRPKLNDKVEPGQKVAIQRNSFGEVVAAYTSAVAGEVAGLRTDVTSEPGDPLTFILFNKATPEGVESYPE